MSETNYDLKNTPLYYKHLEAGAKMVSFSGWSMPLRYTGILDEHMHTRTRAGIFDICHMGEFFLRGPSVAEDLDRLVTCRIDDMSAGRCRYGFLLDENGGIMDDLIVFKISPEEFMLVVNAGTIAKDSFWIGEHISQGTVFTDETDNIAKLDVQGPLSGEIMASLAGGDVVKGLKRYHFTHVDIGGARILLSRTGYTGELGYELFLSAVDASGVWGMLMEFDEVKPVGLGARDTLRMEMGYSLYGKDIDEGRTPLEANLRKFVFMEKDFIGREALLKQETEGVKRVLTGFICEGRRSARSHFKVLSGDRDAGEVTSGAFSPCLKKGMGLCYIDSEFAVAGQEIVLSDGRSEVKAVVKEIPLYEHEKREN